MKRLGALALTLILALCVCGCGAEGAPLRVMTSFYPMYVFALNVFDGIEGVRVDCMTAPQTGCLHDYQLLVSDMMRLADADALIVCGAGMEGYLGDVVARYPALPVIDCSAGIDLICEAGHSHDADEHADLQEAHAYNAHTWLDARNAMQIVRTIAREAGGVFPAYAQRLQDNAEAYIARLTLLDMELETALLPVKGRQIVTFHEAFPYFARRYGLEIAAVVTDGHEEALSPARLAEVVEQVRAAGAPPLFTEPQYDQLAARAIAAETGARLYSLDPLVTGQLSPAAYEDGMRANARALLEALGQ